MRIDTISEWRRDDVLRAEGPLAVCCVYRLYDRESGQ